MNEIKQVLALTDLSASLTPAVKAGVLTAEKFGAQLVVLHVVEEQASDEVFGLEVQAKVMEETREALANALKELGEESDAQVSTEVRKGSPFDEISKAVKEHNIDLIVCGVGRGGEGYGIGIVAKRLAHKLPVDILFVRDGHDNPADTILVATDFSDCSNDALSRAVAYAKVTGLSKVHAVHSFELPSHHHLTGHSEEEVASRMLAHAQKHGEEWLAKADTDGVEVSLVYKQGAPAPTVIAEAKAIGADRIFVGSHGRTASSAVLLGNVAERIVGGAHCSVWAERTDGQAMNFAQAIARLMGIS